MEPGPVFITLSCHRHTGSYSFFSRVKAFPFVHFLFFYDAAAKPSAFLFAPTLLAEDLSLTLFLVFCLHNHQWFASIFIACASPPAVTAPTVYVKKRGKKKKSLALSNRGRQFVFEECEVKYAAVAILAALCLSRPCGGGETALQSTRLDGGALLKRAGLLLDGCCKGVGMYVCVCVWKLHMSGFASVFSPAFSKV